MNNENMHKKMKTKILAYLMLIVGILTGCDNWMNLEPEDDLIKQEFWKKKADVEAVLAATYDAFRDNSLNSLIWGEIRADMVDIYGPDFNDYARIAGSDINPTNGVIKWKDYYFVINMANTLLEFSPEVLDLDEEFSEREKLAYDAEALFIRSLTYFYLVRLWKEVPLNLSSSSTDTVNFYLPKSSEREVLNQIVKDLTYAETIAYTTENIGSTEVFRGRANVFSIQALLADIYLWMENYAKCLEYCNKIIDKGPYQLLSTNNWFELYYPGNSIESIFELQFNDTYNERNPIYDKLLTLGGAQQVYPTMKLREELFLRGDIRICGRASITWKYRGKSLTSAEAREDTEKDANFIYYRLAEILLMKAESLAELGNFTEAQLILNQVSERAGQVGTYFGDDLDAAREAILLERAREFGLEGKRWFDVLRFAKKERFSHRDLIISMLLENTSVKMQPVIRSRILDSMSYYLPIPEADINYNKNLKQNPFYDK
jgi:starch-binding outer membrane protein, SusD/RagB family